MTSSKWVFLSCHRKLRYPVATRFDTQADPRLLMNFSQMRIGKLFLWEHHNVQGTGGSRY
jgi:hypothetical protein